jgi:Family of unknown function (DUF6000)
MWDQELITKWVAPYYLKILHANYAEIESAQERVEFNQQVITALAAVNEEVVIRLLQEGWREKLTGSWLCGLKNWQQFTPLLGALLVESRTCFATEESAAFLVTYLDTYLPRLDLQYDQHWAMPALLWVDEQLGTTYAQKFLVPGGLWEHYTADKLHHSNAWQLTECKRQFLAAMEYCRTNFEPV